MHNIDILRMRLINQQIASTKFKKPEQIVQHMLAMQAQEYGFAKWAIGLRLPGSTDNSIENAFNEGKILRTHLLRPTWHFVHPEDIRWLLALSKPRVNAALASYNRKLELNDKIFKQSNELLIKLLKGGKFLTREKIRDTFKTAKINTDETRLAHLLFNAELEGLICSGPRDGKQFTYGLLEERVAPFKQLSHEEAIEQITIRYFSTRGPATIHDFAWWSGLSMKDVREGLSMHSSSLKKVKVEDKEYFFSSQNIKMKHDAQTSFLMPDYDEYGISYKDRSILFAKHHSRQKQKSNPIFNHMVIIDGIIAGTWERIINNNKIKIMIRTYDKPNSLVQREIKVAKENYMNFITGEKNK